MHVNDLDELVAPGIRVAFADGTGSPRALTKELSRAAGRRGNVRLLLGWTPRWNIDLDPAAFTDIRTVMSGWGLRRAVESGQVHPVPTRLSAVPALLHGPLRPDLLVATVVAVDGGFAFGSEVSWLRAAVDAGATVAGLVSTGAPRSDGGPPLPTEQVTVVGETDEAPLALSTPEPTPTQEAIARNVAAFVSEGARLQVGVGQLGEAVLRAIDVPIRVDSGLLGHGLVHLDRRGLLVGDPVGTYLAGGPELYAWADQRPILRPIEFSHDLGRLSTEPPLVAVNTALEIDLAGQVNVEGTASAQVGGIGGHPDYAAAAARSLHGVSIIALPSTHRDTSTLVTDLSRPVTTPSHDVDLVVTERGAVDLRGRDRAERAEALRDLWGPAEVRQEAP